MRDPNLSWYLIIEVLKNGSVDFTTGQCCWPSQIVYGDSSIMYVLDTIKTRETMEVLNLSQYTPDNIQKTLCTYYCPSLLGQT